MSTDPILEQPPAPGAGLPKAALQWTALVGKDLLLRHYNEVFECRLMEVSPSGKLIKIVGDKDGWVERTRCQVMEVLPKRMKSWQIQLTIGSVPPLTAAVYLKAYAVVQTSHDSIKADGMSIRLPGNVSNVNIIVP